MALFLFNGGLFAAWEMKEIPIPGSSENFIWYEQADFTTEGDLVDGAGQTLLTNGAYVLLSLNVSSTLDIVQIFSSKADYFTSLRSVAFSDYAIDPFNNKWLFSALNDVSVEREEVVLDYKQNVLAFCAYFTCSMDVTGSGVEGEYHGKTIRFFRISEGAVLDGTLIYFDELINESINAVTESLIGDLGIKKEYSIESYF